jgi:hypothetical protein
VIAVPSGEDVLLEFEAEKFKTTTLLVTEDRLPPSGEVPVSVTLVPIPAKVLITSSPSGASVYIEGKEAGVTPLSAEVPVTGEGLDTEVGVALDGYEDSREKIRLQPGISRTVAFTLKFHSKVLKTAQDQLEPKPLNKLGPETVPEYLVSEMPRLSSGGGFIKIPETIPETELFGSVHLDLFIDRGGLVREVNIVSGPSPGVSEAVAAAAKRFVFSPAISGGRPVPVRMRYVVPVEQRSSSRH